MVSTSSKAPSPLEWHPAYAHMTWLRDWLEGQEQHVCLPLPQRPAVAVVSADDLFPVEPVRDLILTKQRAWGPAPFVGDPFHYEWPVATDNLGRQIAGDSTIVVERDAWMYGTAAEPVRADAKSI